MLKHEDARRTDGEDSESGQIVPLYNPRIQRWAEHFQETEEHAFEVTGLSAQGLATIARLQMNNPDLVNIRRLLAELGIHWRVERSE